MLLFPIVRHPTPTPTPAKTKICFCDLKEEWKHLLVLRGMGHDGKALEPETLELHSQFNSLAAV